MSENNKSYIRKSQYENIQLSIYLDAKGHLLDLDLQHLDQAASTQPAITALIDHTLLKPDATEEQIRTRCEEALEYQFGAVCVNSCGFPFVLSYCKAAASRWRGDRLPLGIPRDSSKIAESRQALQDGACELDMVMNYGKLKAGDYTYVANDIREIVRLAHKHDALVKVILETSMLSEQEKVIACLIAKEVGADFVMTSPGFAGGSNRGRYCVDA
jgi:deoxyribose-phosphate aldolase